MMIYLITLMPCSHGTVERYDKNITDQLIDVNDLDPADFASEDDYQTAIDF